MTAVAKGKSEDAALKGRRYGMRKYRQERQAGLKSGIYKMGAWEN